MKKTIFFVTLLMLSFQSYAQEEVKLTDFLKTPQQLEKFTLLLKQVGYETCSVIEHNVIGDTVHATVVGSSGLQVDLKFWLQNDKLYLNTESGKTFFYKTGLLSSTGLWVENLCFGNPPVSGKVIAPWDIVVELDDTAKLNFEKVYKFTFHGFEYNVIGRQWEGSSFLLKAKAADNTRDTNVYYFYVSKVENGTAVYMGHKGMESKRFQLSYTQTNIVLGHNWDGSSIAFFVEE